MNLWKVVGLAGVAGVTAAGVIMARDQRQRTQLAPEDIRARLHERLEQVPPSPALPDAPAVSVSPERHLRWVPLSLRRRWAHRHQAAPDAGLK